MKLFLCHGDKSATAVSFE